jgi:hypothetical protein
MSDLLSWSVSTTNASGGLVGDETVERDADVRGIRRWVIRNEA